MSRPETLLRSRWPATPEYALLARELARGLSGEIISLVYRGIDMLLADVPPHEWHGELAQLERSLGQLLYTRILRLYDPTLPFVPVHEAYDFELLHSRRARPPQPDIGFVLNAFERAVWPVETKVLRNEADVSEYCEEVRENFLTFRYASFTGEGAMLGYLLNGDPETAFSNIARGIPCTLSVGDFEPPRYHRLSSHTRQVPEGEHYSPALVCHHLIAPMGVRVEASKGEEQAGEEQAA